MSADVSVRPITPEDREQVLALWEGQLGAGYADDSKIDAALNDGTGTILLVAEARQQDAGLVGFAIGRLMHGEELAEYIGLPQGLLDVTERVGLLDVNCVAAEWQGQGIGSRLTGARLDQFEDRGCGSAYAVCWVREETDSRAVVSKFGLEEIAYLPEYWREDSLEHEYTCPDCGTPPCRCDAAIYGKSF